MKKVLVVDYDPKATGALKSALEARGLQVETASNGEAALERFHAFQPDAVIIEPMLPKLHGFEVCKKIRSLPAGQKLPLFWWTKVYKGKKYQTESKHQYQVTEHFERPLDDAKVADGVAKALGLVVAPAAEAQPKVIAAPPPPPPPKMAAPPPPPKAEVPLEPQLEMADVEAVDTAVVSEAASEGKVDVLRMKEELQEEIPPKKQKAKDLSKAKASLKDTLKNLKRAPKKGTVSSPYGLKKTAGAAAMTPPPEIDADLMAIGPPPSLEKKDELLTTAELFGDLLDEDASTMEMPQESSGEQKGDEYQTQLMEPAEPPLREASLDDFEDSEEIAASLEPVRPEDSLFTLSDEEAAPTRKQVDIPREEAPDLSALEELEGAVEGEGLPEEFSGDDDMEYLMEDAGSKEEKESALAEEGDNLFPEAGEAEASPSAWEEDADAGGDVFTPGEIPDAGSAGAELDSLLEDEPSGALDSPPKTEEGLLTESLYEAPGGLPSPEEEDSLDLAEGVGGLLEEMPSAEDEGGSDEAPGDLLEAPLAEEREGKEEEGEEGLEEIHSMASEAEAPLGNEEEEDFDFAPRGEKDLDFAEEEGEAEKLAAPPSDDTSKVDRDDFMEEFSSQRSYEVDFLEEEPAEAAPSPAPPPSPAAETTDVAEEFSIEEPSASRDSEPAEAEENEFVFSEEPALPPGGKGPDAEVELDELLSAEPPSMEDAEPEAPSAPPAVLALPKREEKSGPRRMEDSGKPAAPPKAVAPPEPARAPAAASLADTKPRIRREEAMPAARPAKSGGFGAKAAFAAIVVAALGAGGFFAWKHLAGGKAAPAAVPAPVPAETSASGSEPIMDVDRLEKKPAPVNAPAPPVPEGVTAPRGVQVFVSVWVDAKGRVREAATVHNPTENAALAKAAEDAVKQWTFSPGIADGREVDVRMTVPVRFREE